MNTILKFPEPEVETPVPTPEPSPWKVSRLGVAGIEGVIEFRRSTPQAGRAGESCPEFAKALAAFRSGPIVEKYENARCALVESIELERKAAGAVADSETAIVNAAGDGKQALAKADTQHEKALNDHGRLAKRVTLLREACDHSWAELNRELTALNGRLTAEIFAEAGQAIKNRQAEIVELLGGMLDELDKLFVRRERAARYRYDVHELRLQAPPKADDDE